MLLGELRYETIGEPVRTAVCHCRYCQLRTGTAFGISVYFKTNQITFNDAPFQTYSYDTEGGNKVLTRCANCGTNVSWKMSLEALKDTIGIAGGTFAPSIDLIFWSSSQSFETGPIPKPVRESVGRLKGRLMTVEQIVHCPPEYTVGVPTDAEDNHHSFNFSDGGYAFLSNAALSNTTPVAKSICKSNSVQIGRLVRLLI